MILKMKDDDFNENLLLDSYVEEECKCENQNYEHLQVQNDPSKDEVV
jgi:hypothetical protein